MIGMCKYCVIKVHVGPSGMLSVVEPYWDNVNTPSPSQICSLVTAQCHSDTLVVSLTGKSELLVLF